MKTLITILFATILYAGGVYFLTHLPTEEPQPIVAVGTAPRVFFSSQVGTGPQNNYILSTDGTNSTWIANTGSSGGGLWSYEVEGTDVLSPLLASTSNTARVTASSFHATSTATSSSFNSLTFTYASGTAITATNLWGTASLATALAANGANCSAGNSPLGVDASGAVESCFDVWTEAENTAAAYTSYADTDVSSYLYGSTTRTDLYTAGTGLSWTGTTLNAEVQTSDLHDAITLSGTPDYITLSGQDIVRGTVDISDDTNLAVSGTLLNLTGDTLSVNEGTLTDTKICTYESGTGIQCTTDPSGSLHSSSGTYVYPTGGLTHAAPSYSATTTTGLALNASSTISIRTVAQNALRIFEASGGESVSIFTDSNGNLVIDPGSDSIETVGTDITTQISRAYHIEGSGGGSESAPTYAINSDTNTGMYSDTADTLQFTTGGTNRLTVNSTGLGISTSSPEAKLDVWGTTSGKILTLFSNAGTKFMEMLNTGVTTLLGVWDFGGATSLEIPNGTSPTVDVAGEIAINTASSSFMFSSSTNHASEIKAEFVWFGPTFASTSLAYDGDYGATGTTTVVRAGARYNIILDSFYCQTDKGSALINIGNGVATSSARCTTSGVAVTPATHFGARVPVLMEVGSQSGDPNQIYTDATARWE